MKAALPRTFVASATPALSREETAELVVRAQGGDVQARGRLVSSNLRFVAQVAFKMPGPAELEDRLSAGMIGLNRAIDTFEPERGLSLLTYAVQWIRVEIQRAHQAATTVRGGFVMDRGRRSPWVYPQSLSLDAPVTEEGGTTHADVLEADVVHLDAALDEAKLAAQVEAAIAKLDEREQRIIRARFFERDEYAENTLKLLGEEMGFSRERARQLELRALRKLRALLSAPEVPEPAVVPPTAASEAPMSQMEKATALAQRIREGQAQLDTWKRELVHLVQGADQELAAIRALAGVRAPRRKALPAPSVGDQNRALPIDGPKVPSRGDRVLAILREKGTLRAGEVASALGDREDLVSVALVSLTKRGLARRVGRGLYEAAA